MALGFGFSAICKALVLNNETFSQTVALRPPANVTCGISRNALVSREHATRAQLRAAAAADTAANHNVRLAIMTTVVFLAECARTHQTQIYNDLTDAAVCSASSNREFVIGGAAGSDAGAVTSVPQRVSLDIGHLQAGVYTQRL